MKEIKADNLYCILQKDLHKNLIKVKVGTHNLSIKTTNPKIKKIAKLNSEIESLKNEKEFKRHQKGLVSLGDRISRAKVFPKYWASCMEIKSKHLEIFLLSEELTASLTNSNSCGIENAKSNLEYHKKIIKHPDGFALAQKSLSAYIL